MSEIVVVAKYGSATGLNAEEVFVNAGKYRPLSNERVDLLVKSGKFSKYVENGPFWTGTFFGYKPGLTLGSKVVWKPGKDKYVLNISDKEMQKSKNSIVLFNLTDENGNLNFNAELPKNAKGERVIEVVEKALFVVEGFPSEDGWYLAKRGIPFGEKVSSNLIGARRLWRVDAGAGLVSRDVISLYNGRSVDFFISPLFSFGVLGEKQDEIVQVKLQMQDIPNFADVAEAMEFLNAKELFHAQQLEAISAAKLQLTDCANQLDSHATELIASVMLPFQQ